MSLPTRIHPGVAKHEQSNSSSSTSYLQRLLVSNDNNNISQLLSQSALNIQQLERTSNYLRVIKICS
ncbi:unnamed protein product [Schistosoma mattheei]|uniref:Uncharacterized protein n=1 Tax=Schistosoma mattheei TaxID=31246 RepID=A0AA85BGZ0_9TREM|nr:unnamed protein product [Schistosoma mattheei]